MKKIFVNGTFDVLHRGHIELLSSAKSLGDWLVVAIDSDRRVSEKKGVNRPINNEIDRLIMLLSLRCVDEVEVFDSDEELIKSVKFHSPDIMVVGSDWRGKPIIGSSYAKELKFFDRIDGYSTTGILEKGIDG